jgi:hypothetical protein
MTSHARARRAPRRAATALGGAAVLALLGAACDASSSSEGTGPLEPTTADMTTVGLDISSARVQDVNAHVTLANPTEHAIRLLSVRSVPNAASPVHPRVVTFRLAGPGRTTSIPASKAVIPAGAEEDDYLLMVRYAVPKGTTWASDKGLTLTYSTRGHTYTSTWQRRITMCSRAAMGEKFCADPR